MRHTFVFKTKKNILSNSKIALIKRETVSNADRKFTFVVFGS